MKLKYCVSERQGAFSCLLHRSRFLFQMVWTRELDFLFCFLSVFLFPSGLTLFLGGTECCSESAQPRPLDGGFTPWGVGGHWLGQRLWSGDLGSSLKQAMPKLDWSEHRWPSTAFQIFLFLSHAEGLKRRNTWLQQMVFFFP